MQVSAVLFWIYRQKEMRATDGTRIKHGYEKEASPLPWVCLAIVFFHLSVFDPCSIRGSYLDIEAAMNEEVRALTRQGITLAQEGKLAEAAACFTEVLRLEPNFGHGYNNLANVFLFQGRYDEAIANYYEAVKLLPNDAGIYSHLSYAYSKRGNGPDAEACARQALSLNPQFPEAHNHLGIALGLQGSYAEAEASYQAALQLRPGFSKALSNLGQLYFLERRFDDALAAAQDAIRADPNQPEAHATLAAVFIRRHQWDDALASCREALRLDPRLPEAHYNLATIYMETGRFEEAKVVCEEFLRSRPDYVDMETVLGTIALKQNRVDDALQHYDKLLFSKPAEALVHFNRAVAWLLLGNFDEGWAEYEWRWRWQDFVIKPFATPPWDGSPLAGKTILLHAEQGLGDTIQFIRYAPLVQARGGKVVAACQGSLLRLLSHCRGIDELVAQETYAGKTDEHVPLLSLPHLFKTKLATIPASIPYVFADPRWWNHGEHVSRVCRAQGRHRLARQQTASRGRGALNPARAVRAACAGAGGPFAEPAKRLGARADCRRAVCGHRPGFRVGRVRRFHGHRGRDDEFGPGYHVRYGHRPSRGRLGCSCLGGAEIQC